MKKSLTLILLSLLGAGVMYAGHLTPTQALARVKGNSQARKVIGNRSIAPQLIAELPELYVFSSGNGFMILPADDSAMPLLGYSDSGEFCPEQIPALKWWLSTYSEQIAEATAAGISTQADTSTPEREPVKPLLKTTWGQDSPYNDLAPELYGRKCYTGCVATAMAQVMKYHNYPTKGQGSISYSWNSTTLAMDFSDVTFYWNNMLDSYNSTATDEQKLAVATLMKACGYSVKMNYLTTASGANSVYIGSALIDYFDYDQGIWQTNRNFYELSDWEDLIYADIAAGRPVIYFGQSSGGGHQFVCDGYSSDGLFHFNWGWDGLSDGYFRLNALNPPSQGIGGFDGGYNMNQSVVLGIRPPVEGSKPIYTLTSSDDFRPKNGTVQLGGYVIFNCAVTNTGAMSIPAQTEIDIELVPDDGGEPTYVKCQTTPVIAPNLGYGSGALSAQFPKTLAEGTYTARMVFKVPGGEWQPVLFPLSNNSELTATVKDSNISFVAENEPGVTITDLPEDKTIYIGTTFSLSMTLTNKTDTEYLGSMFPRIIKSGSSKVLAWGSSTNIELTGNQTMPFEYVGSLTADADVTLEPGEYQLYFYSQQSNQPICEPVPVTLDERPAKTSIEVTDFQFDGIQPGDIAKFSWTLTCTEGYYDDSMTLYLLDSDGKIVTYRSVSPYLNAGESKQCTIEIPLGDLDFGSYSGALYYDSRRQQEASFSYLDNSTSIEEVTLTPADSNVYDLQGRRVTKPAPGHIYIRGNKLIRW